MAIKITNRARESIRRIVDQIEEVATDSADKRSDRATEFLEDVEFSFNQIEQAPSPIGAKQPYSEHQDARILELNRFNGFVLIYLKNDDEVVILDLLNSWMTGI